MVRGVSGSGGSPISPGVPQSPGKSFVPGVPEPSLQGNLRKSRGARESPGDSGVLWRVLWLWSQSGSPDLEGIPSVRESPDPRGSPLARESPGSPRKFPDPPGSPLARGSPRIPGKPGSLLCGKLSGSPGKPHQSGESPVPRGESSVRGAQESSWSPREFLWTEALRIPGENP